MSLYNFDFFDGFRDQPVEIGVSLTMGMADHVYRDAVNEDREVGAVVRIETAKEDLIGFAAAMMLADDQSRH